MSLLLIIEIIIIIFFLVMFYRQTNVVWAVGLLTATTAVLFNVIFNIFGANTGPETLGLWPQILGGLAFGGAAFWLLGMLQSQLNLGNFTPQTDSSPHLNGASATAGPADAATTPAQEQLLSRRAVGMRNDASEYDQQLLYEQIKKNLGPEDVLDLLFDLEMAENEVIAPTNNMNQTIHNIIDTALERDQVGDLALAVERILTPVPPDHFPRLSRITVESPPTILRRYMLTFYDLETLKDIANALEIDWERLGLGSKQQKVRNLLLWIRRRNRMAELIEAMHARPVVSGNVNLR